MSASLWLGVASIAAIASAVPVALCSRWLWLSPWCTLCTLAASGLDLASGAEGGGWPPLTLGAFLAVSSLLTAVVTAGARRRIAAELAGGPEAGRD